MCETFGRISRFAIIALTLVAVSVDVSSLRANVASFSLDNDVCLSHATHGPLLSFSYIIVLPMNFGD
jgi:hypothetical protein